MKKLIVALSLAFAFVFMPASGAYAKSFSGGTSSSGGGVHGKIISVTTTNFSMASPAHGRGRHRRVRSTLVHYNPDSVTITVDGVQVRSLDVAATGKYVSVAGVMKNNILEATSIAVSSTPPSHGKKKSASA